ncbi:hypothetical protein Tco_0557462, partial [Tanacetum coccineum]
LDDRQKYGSSDPVEKTIGVLLDLIRFFGKHPLAKFVECMSLANFTSVTNLLYSD